MQFLATHVKSKINCVCNVVCLQFELNLLPEVLVLVFTLCTNLFVYQKCLTWRWTQTYFELCWFWTWRVELELTGLNGKNVPVFVFILIRFRQAYHKFTWDIFVDTLLGSLEVRFVRICQTHEYKLGFCRVREILGPKFTLFAWHEGPEMFTNRELTNFGHSLCVRFACACSMHEESVRIAPTVFDCSVLACERNLFCVVKNCSSIFVQNENCMRIGLFLRTLTEYRCHLVRFLGCSTKANTSVFAIPPTFSPQSQPSSNQQNYPLQVKPRRAKQDKLCFGWPVWKKKNTNVLVDSRTTISLSSCWIQLPLVCPSPEEVRKMKNVCIHLCTFLMTVFVSRWFVQLNTVS